MIKNYSEAEVKVREVTSNDPWGAKNTLSRLSRTSINTTR